jgi:hypothetical protein
VSIPAYHGLLIAPPLDPPLDRTLVFAKADTELVVGERRLRLSTSTVAVLLSCSCSRSRSMAASSLDQHESSEQRPVSIGKENINSRIAFARSAL